MVLSNRQTVRCLHNSSKWAEKPWYYSDLTNEKTEAQRSPVSKCEPVPLEQQLMAHLKRESSPLLISLIKHIHLFCLRGYMTAPKFEACSYPEKIPS